MELPDEHLTTQKDGKFGATLHNFLLNISMVQIGMEHPVVLHVRGYMTGWQGKVGRRYAPSS
jgi:hypothetical protein